MDDIYATELLRQDLTDALEREDNLKQSLQAAQTEMQSLQIHAHEHKTKHQQLDDLLEAEEAKTHAERLARQEAEETTRQHRAEIHKLRRNETTANQHCEAAESEVINLQRELSTERPAAVTAGIHSARLCEELRQAEANGMAAYDMLNAARAKIYALEQDLRVASDCISMLEHQARGFEEIAQKERQRASEAEKGLSATTSEIKSTELKFSNLLEQYNALEIEHSKCHITDSFVRVTNLNTTSTADDTQSPISLQTTDTPPSQHAHDPVHSIDNAKDQTMTIITATSRTPNDRAINPPEMPAIPEPAILRPHPASVTSRQVEIEIFKASGRIVPAANTKNLRWKFFWRLPGNLLRLLIRESDGR